MSWVITGVSKPPLLLDTYPGAAAAYSLRSLSLAYGGSVVRVRRSSDNTESDFTATQVTDGSLATFCGAGNGFVRTWYDQSGNGRNLTQTTQSAQPKIYDSSTGLITENSKPAIAFAGGASSGPYLELLSFGKAQLQSGLSIVSVFNFGTTNDRNGTIYFENSFRTGVPWLIVNAFFSSGQQSEIYVDAGFRLNQNCASNALNLSTLTLSPAAVWTRATNNGTPSSYTGLGVYLGENMRIGSGFFSFPKMQLPEIIIYASDISANLPAVTSNINAHYAIY